VVDSKTRGEVMLRFDDPGSDRQVVLEDNGRVAYAYLLVKERIVGDVWLYNVGPNPEEVDWRDRSGMPFRNPRRFCEEREAVTRLRLSSDIRCEWSTDGVDVYLGEKRLARLSEGAKPGWSRHAGRRGPLANPLKALG
jgi:hypothetical protein